MRDRKGMDLDEKRSGWNWEELEGEEGRETVIGIYCMTKESFLINGGN